MSPSQILVIIDTGNYLHDGTKPFPESMLTYDQWGPVACILYSTDDINHLNTLANEPFKIPPIFPRDQWVKGIYNIKLMTKLQYAWPAYHSLPEIYVYSMWRYVKSKIDISSVYILVHKTWLLIYKLLMEKWVWHKYSFWCVLSNSIFVVIYLHLFCFILQHFCTSASY